MMSPVRRFLLAALLSMVAALPLHAQEAVPVSTLTQNPDRYAGRTVAVAGSVWAYRERVTGSGDPYTIFDLRDGKASVMIFAWPHKGLRDGLRVRVTGTFMKIKTYTFIKAQRTIVLR